MISKNHADLLDVLAQVPASACDYTEWTMVGMALKAEGYPLAAWDGWSRDTDPSRYHEGECAKKWAGFSDGRSDGVGAGTVCEIARSHGAQLSRHGPDEAFGWTDEVAVVDPAYVEPMDLPDSATDGDWDPARQLTDYLRAVFEETERVCVVTQSWRGDDGKHHPKKGDWSRTAGELIAELERYHDVAKVIGDWDAEAGVWVCHNPVDGNGRANANVTALRHVLIESDEDDPERQLATMRALNLPLAAVVSSGNKSMHGIVRVDAATMEEYKRRVSRLYEECARAGMHVDGQNRNPSRLSRLPGVTRGGKRQSLIATNVGARSFEEWEDWIAEERDDLPETTSLADALADLPPLADPLIEGILRKGHKMLVAGPSKAGKSFGLMELCVAVAEGLTWMGRACSQGRVLYVNLEIDEASSLHRFAAIYDALGIAPANAANIDVWNLRGKACPMDKLAPRLIHRAAKKGRDPEHGGYSLIIIDPLYKVITGDENSASDMARFCNQFDRVCNELGCSVVYCHHHSKGFQGTKHSIDRMSGSGVFARDPDAILDMTPLAATTEELSCVRDQQAEVAIRATLDAAGLVPPANMDLGALSVWAMEHLDREEGDDLLARLKGISEGSADATAWRISFTLREFGNADQLDVWFDYPLHVPDHRGVLSKCPYDGGEARSTDGSGRPRAKAREDKQRALEEAFEAVSMGADEVRIDELAEYLEVSAKTVQRRVDESMRFERHNGIVRRSS